MPKLDRRELGELDECLICRRAGCGRNVATVGDGPCSGFALPFCPADLRRLSRRTFNALCNVAGASIFDIDGVAEAAALVASARLELSTKLRQAKKR